jgi:hypothetical protein
MDMKGKTKDNMKVKMDMPLFCHYKNMKLVYDGSWVAKPKSNFSFRQKYIITCLLMA